MNTPRTKKPKRYIPPKTVKTEDGSYSSGITNEKLLKLVGGVITIWTHIEEQMIPIFAELIGIDTDRLGDARLIFRSIINHNTRVDIMRAMLERGPLNQHMGEAFDKLIDDFNSLAKIRNNYAHGLWYTSKTDGKVYIEGEGRAVYDHFLAKREVAEKELTDIGARMNGLLSDLLAFHWQRESRARARVLTESLHKQARK